MLCRVVDVPPQKLRSKKKSWCGVPEISSHLRFASFVHARLSTPPATFIHHYKYIGLPFCWSLHTVSQELVTKEDDLSPAKMVLAKSKNAVGLGNRYVQRRGTSRPYSYYSQFDERSVWEGKGRRSQEGYKCRNSKNQSCHRRNREYGIHSRMRKTLTPSSMSRTSEKRPAGSRCDQLLSKQPSTSFYQQQSWRAQISRPRR